MALQIQLQCVPDGGATRKQRAKAVLTHIGLVLFALLYIAFGALILHVVESTHEIDQKLQSVQEIAEFKKDFPARMWALSRRPNVDAKRFSREAEAQLKNFTDVLHLAFAQRRLTVDEIRPNSTRLTHEWSFPGSLLFSVSVLGTIGYGRPVPQTTLGRLLCVVFAFFGLPLFWMMTVDMAALLSIGILKVYPYYAKLANPITRSWSKLVRRTKRSSNATPAGAAEAEDASGLPNEGDSDPSSRLVKGAQLQAAGTSDLSAEQPGAQAPENMPTVSIFFLLIILISYIALGAAFIPLWETGNEWTYFGAFYYCFITITTIGFGDMVPNNQRYILATITYVLIGLVIITSCILLLIYGCIRNSRFYRAPAVDVAITNSTSAGQS